MSVRATRLVISFTVPLIAMLVMSSLLFRKKSPIHRKPLIDRFGNFENGDIIFQVSRSSQSQAIQFATHSKYSHMGIIYEEHGYYYVYEAIQPVRLTGLREWIKRGENAHYAVKRLKDTSVLTPANLSKMKSIGEKYRGKSYDLYFGWTDDKIYCSELVWKIYHETFGLEIGKLQELKDFDLSGEVVKAKLKERYGDKIPLNEKVISPAAMFESDKLEDVVIKK
jgi:hypothetical protein